MNRLQKLYLKEFFLFLSGLSIILSLLFSVVSIIDNMDELVKAGLKSFNILLYGLLRIPEFLRYLLPMTVLLCVIFVISLASRRNELIAIKSSGIDLRKFFIPFVITGTLLVAVDFLVSEFLAPITIKEANAITRGKRGRPYTLSKQGNIWLKGKDGSIVRIGLYVPQKKQMKDISIFYFKNKVFFKRIEAKYGILVSASSSTAKSYSLKLSNVTEYDLINMKVSYLKQKTIDDITGPDVFERERNRIEEMGIFELRKYEKRLRDAGFRNTKMMVDIQSRLAYPLSNLFMVLAGISISIRSRKGKGIMSAAIGVILALVYWAGFTLSLSLGYAGVIPPIIAAWSIPIVSLIAGVVYYVRLPV